MEVRLTTYLMEVIKSQQLLVNHVMVGIMMHIKYQFLAIYFKSIIKYIYKLIMKLPNTYIYIYI